MERMTKQEAALFFGVTERTLERWVLRGLLPAGLRSGRRIYWDKEALEAARKKMSEQFEHGLDAQFKRWRSAILEG